VSLKGEGVGVLDVSNINRLYSVDGHCVVLYVAFGTYAGSHRG